MHVLRARVWHVLENVRFALNSCSWVPIRQCRRLDSGDLLVKKYRAIIARFAAPIAGPTPVPGETTVLKIDSQLGRALRYQSSIGTERTVGHFDDSAKD